MGLQTRTDRELRTCKAQALWSAYEIRLAIW